MSPISRRAFLELMGAVVISSIIGDKPTAQQIDSMAVSLSRREYGGTDFTGWEVVGGDGVYAAPGEPLVNSGDIETVHYGSYSELRANILIRKIMAHNITFKRIYDNDAFKFVHTGKYKFQLPYQPSTGNPDLNGETLEGHLAIWDGINTKLDYIVALQWILNPWATNFGAIQAWNNPGVWQTVGQLTPDTSWHEVQMILDTGKARTELVIDGTPYQSYFTAIPRPGWGEEIAARLAGEIISLFPGTNGALHRAYFKDWSWIWEPRNIYLPIVIRNN
jgi:hypothetical protein